MGDNVIQLATLYKGKLPIVLGISGIILIITAVLIENIKLNQKASWGNGPIISQTFTASEAGIISQKKVKVDIEGAVIKPGLYEIPNDSRIQDVLISAGGLTAKANIGENSASGAIVLSSQAKSSLVNINTASESELDTLSGVGPVTARKIVAGRPYQNISDLLKLKLISSSTYDKIKDSITIF
ncbi:helix-hairpin-helix domain-containing protein [Candidatus Microgenomates bacterium]|nr:helix-hairpin-helix domain-containing protein [Candidatus Microgenomates bacterium]